MKRLRPYVFLFLLIASGCIQRIDFDSPPADLYLVVEGQITDQSPPYEVRLSRGLDLDDDIDDIQMLSSAEIVLYDDQGASETLVEVEDGVYETMGVIQGTIGRSYHIEIETGDGRRYETVPEELKPVGQVEEIRFEYEARTSEEEFGDVAADVFNIYVDADAGEQSLDQFVRWKFSGTYQVTTNPELNFFWAQGGLVDKIKIPDPHPCSGYIAIWPGGSLSQVDECTCCTCYPRQFETIPQLSDLELIDDGRFINIKVGEVPINRTTFEDKYLVTIEQLSMTRNAFEFFRLVREQKESASNIFQPVFGEITGNVVPVNTDIPAIGIFYASASSKKSRFIYRSDVPYNVVLKNTVTDDCRLAYEFSTTDIPVEWQ